MEALARQVEARALWLAEASVEGLYADPFWFARYGEERARRFGGEDALFHVRYLVQALDTRDAGVMERYARWLQGLLVPRGMCSLHLARHFQGLRQALVRANLGEPPLALDYVRAAESALDWPEDPSRAVREASPRLVEQVRLHLEQQAAPAPGEAPRLREEVLLQLSYLMDALGTKRPELFAQHARWYADFWPRRNLRWDFPTLLEALERALAQDSTLSDAPRETVSLGRTAAVRKEQT